MERVLVTGANGLLGANIVRQLLLKGYNVRALVRLGYDKKSLSGVDCEILEGEVTSRYDLHRALRDTDYVIHSAARTSQFPSDLKAYKHVNINATKTLMNVSKRYPIKKFVFVSTANCFTNGTLENPGTENSEFMPWLKKSGYAYSKYLAQQEVLKQVKENSFPAVVVNPTFMIGPFDSKPSSGKLITYAYKNRFLFYPPGGKCFVDVESAAKAICSTLENGKIGEAYLLAGENMTYKSFFRQIEEVSGQKKILIPVPGQLLKFVGKLFDLLQHIFSIPLPLSYVNARMLTLDNYYSNHKAQVELGMKSVKMNDSIIKAVNWFKQHKYL